MADPISATIGLFCSVLQASSAIAEYNEKHQERKAKRAALANSQTQAAELQAARLRLRFQNQASGSRPQVASTPVAKAYDEDEAVEELFLVLGTLGQRLIALEAINQIHLPTACESAYQAINTVSKPLGAAFKDLGQTMQYATTCAIIFCAACYPMHIYRGFGCGVLDKLWWGAHPNDPIYGENSSKTLILMDRALAFLKTIPNSLELLVKQPVGVGDDTPYFTANDKDSDEVKQRLTTICDDVLKAYETLGFPQPKDKSIVITNWSAPFATWNGNHLYVNTFHNIRNMANYQQDPGRYLYAWLVWNRLDLQPGEALVCSKVCHSLAVWLQGLKGTTHKVLHERDMDFTNLKFSPYVEEVSMKVCGNKLLKVNGNFCIIRDPGPSAVVAPSLTQTPSSASVATTSSTGSRHRRPPPPVPVRPKKIVRAMHDFTADDPEELSFLEGAHLEVIDDKRDDGWWKARLNGKIGLIPSSFVEDV